MRKPAKTGKKAMTSAPRTADAPRMGRPPLSAAGSVQIAVRFPQELIEGVDAIVAERFGQADRTAVIRELVAEALIARGKSRR